MSWWSSLRSRAWAVFARERVSAELREELQSHIAHRADDLEQGGMSRAEAERQARVEFGGYERIREETHAALGAHWLETVLWDVRFGLRMLAKSRGFTAVALLTLMLGVGASTAVFSLMDALLIRPLPVPHANQLVAVAYRQHGSGGTEYGLSAPFIRGLEKQHTVFRHVAAYAEQDMQVRKGSGNEDVAGALVSGQYFEALEVKPLLGRYLTPQDDRRGGGPGGFGVVISESFWRDWFDSSPRVIGKTLMIANQPFTVVGVMPKSFIGADPTSRPEIYVPLWSEPVIDAPTNMIAAGVHDFWLTIFARRRAGMSVKKTNAALATVSDQVLRSEVKDAGWMKEAIHDHFKFVAEPASTGFSYLQQEFKKPLLVVFVLCLAMLLLACLNLASLLVARATARERELATRLAMGASRARLMQQLMVESLLVAVAGSGLGVAASPLLSHFLATLMTSSGALLHTTTSVLVPSLDVRVLAFSGMIAFAATLLIGLLPALRATSKDLQEQIQGGSHASPPRRRRQMVLRPLMSLEVGLALMILVGAGLLATSLVQLYRTGLGFRPEGLVNVQLDMSKQPLNGAALAQWYERYLTALKHLPGVKSASYQFCVPLSPCLYENVVQASDQRNFKVLHGNLIAPDYFHTMGIRIVEGRGFRWDDSHKKDEKIVLNQRAAKLLFPGRNALGQVAYGGMRNPMEVIGVVGNAAYMSIRKQPPATAYLPMMLDPYKGMPFTAELRVDGPLQPLATAIRQVTARMAPEVPAPVMTTMEQVVNNSIRSERMMAMLALFFAGCALLIAGIGLYGTLAYMTAQRTSEIGIRMALGAERRQVVRMVLLENAWVTAAGAIVGLGVAATFAKVLKRFLYEISPVDPWVLLVATLLLGVVACAASLVPAVRAARIDPMDAIRCE